MAVQQLLPFHLSICSCLPGRNKVSFSPDPSTHCSAFLPPLQASCKGTACTFSTHGPLASVPTTLLNYSGKSHQRLRLASLLMGFLDPFFMAFSPPRPALVSLSLAILSPPQATLPCLLPKMPVLPRVAWILFSSHSTHSPKAALSLSSGSHHPLGAEDSSHCYQLLAMDRPHGCPPHPPTQHTQ